MSHQTGDGVFVMNQLHEAQARVKELEAENAILKQGRVPCVCGKDTADPKYALCYNCRQEDPHKIAELEAENKRLREFAERIANGHPHRGNPHREGDDHAYCLPCRAKRALEGK